MSWSTGLLCALIVVTACSCAPAGAASIPDPMAYISGLTIYYDRLDVWDPITNRRHDYGHYVETDSFSMGDGIHAVTTWDYPPFGSYELPNDGGEQYVIEGDTVRIEGTRDGGKDYNQYFVGNNCGGTGWVLFRTDADASWRQLVATLSSAQDPWTCSARSKALTRYTRRDVYFPGLGTVDTIISEHYNGGTTNAQVVERFFFGAYYGRLAWQAFATQPGPLPPEQIAERCPDFGWNSLPGKQLIDCRINTNITSPGGWFNGTAMWQLGE